MEFNLFGFAKNAICFRRVIMETDDGQPRHYLMYLSVTHPKTQIIPFRDSAMLMQTITLEECSEGCIIRDVAVVSPIPWLQSNDLFESLERFSYISIRRMKSCFDYIFYNKSTDRQLVCDSITLERIGLEATLNDKHDSIGEVCYETKDTRITGVDFVIDHATFICEGCFHKKCQFKLSRESLLELVFQDRCSIIANTTPQTSIVHKRKPKEYNTDNEDLCFSTFIYSESCALVHFQSVYDRNQPRLRQDAPQVYSFKDSYIFVFGCKDEWTIQYNISIIARTKLSLLDEKEAMFAITHFLKNMAKSVDSFHKPDDYKQPMTFLTSHPRDVSPVMQLPFSLLVTICDYLTPKDVLSFSSTCTHIRDSFKYAIQNGICIGGICPKGGTVHQVESPLRTQPSDFDFDECKKKTPEHIKLHGHTNLIRALDIHPSCTMLVSGSSDRKIRLWDLKDNSSRTFVGPNSSLVTTKFTTKHFIASGYRCGTIRYIHSLDSRQSQVFDVKEGTIDGFYPMQQMNFLVWSEKVYGIQYHDLHQTMLFSYSGHSRKVSVVRPFGNNFISGSADRTIHIWNPNYPSPTIAKIKAHRSGILALEPVNDHVFISAGNDKTINYWDDRNISRPTTTINSKICAMAYSQNKLVCGGDDGKVSIFTADGSQDQIVIDSGNISGMCSIATWGNIIACGFKDGIISLWKY